MYFSAPLNPNYTEGEFNFYFSDLKPKLVITNFENDHAAIICAKKIKLKYSIFKIIFFKQIQKDLLKKL